jgi:PAS domain S-box-containing protein
VLRGALPPWQQLIQIKSGWQCCIYALLLSLHWLRGTFLAMNAPNNLKNELYELVKADAAIFDFLQNKSLDGLWYRNLQPPESEWMNAKFWQTLGYGADYVPAEPTAWRTHINPEDWAEAQRLLETSLHGGTDTYEQVMRYTHRDGSTVWLRCQVLILRDTTGTPTRLLGALIDITKEKQESRYAYEVANHYGSILSSQSVYIVKTDASGNYTYVNDFFVERFGSDMSLIGTSAFDSIIPEDRAKCYEVVVSCFAEPEVPHQVILRKPYRDKTIKSNHWELKGLRGENGEVTEILCVGYDVTLLVENLQRSQHLLDITSQQNIRLQNFAYIISHNIRSHSANLTSLVQLLTESETQEQGDLFLQLLQTSTEKLAETIDNLNEIVTVNSTPNKPKEYRPLREEIVRTLETLSVLVWQYDILVEVQVPEDLSVYVVPAYLDSILLNLLSNAIKYRSPQRPALIQLRAYQEPGAVVLEVQDNGLGIDLVKNQAKLFGMYKTFHDNEDARGVGLFITKNHIEAMGGTIVVESEVEVGSTFKVRFNENA